MATETAGVGIITGQKPVSSGTVQMTAALLYSILTTISVCISPVICDLFNEKRQPSHSGSSYEQHKSPPMLSFVHTFETSDQCGMICPRPCVMRIMEDLEMMQRWICDPSARYQKDVPLSSLPNSHRSTNFALDKEDNSRNFLHNQVLLIIVPLGLLLLLCLIIFIRRCNSKSSSTVDV